MSLTKTNILIGEDNILIAEHLQDILISNGYNVVGLFHNKIDIIAGIKTHQPDIILLDIRMESRYTGVEIGEYITNELFIPFIYITAHAEKDTLQKALKTKPSGYVLKPFREKDVEIAIQLALEKFKKTSDKSYLKNKDGIVTIKILYSDIKCIESDNNYLKIYTKDKKYLSRNSLKNILTDLDDELFVQTHRSFIVNKKYVTQYQNKYVCIGEVQIPVSRKYVDAVNAIFDYL